MTLFKGQAEKEEMHELKHLRQEAPSYSTREMDENYTSEATGGGTSGGFGSFRPFTDSKDQQDPPAPDLPEAGVEDVVGEEGVIDDHEQVA